MDLSRPLDVKDEAHYGIFTIAGQDLKSALRQARTLLAFAERASRR